jgi:hypothetical protein
MLKEMWMDSSGSGYEQILGSCEHGNEPMGVYKMMENFRETSNYYYRFFSSEFPIKTFIHSSPIRTT